MLTNDMRALRAEIARTLNLSDQTRDRWLGVIDRVEVIAGPEGQARVEKSAQQWLAELDELLVSAMRLSAEVAPDVFARRRDLGIKLKDLFSDFAFAVRASQRREDARRIAELLQ